MDTQKPSTHIAQVLEVICDVSTCERRWCRGSGVCARAVLGTEVALPPPDTEEVQGLTNFLHETLTRGGAAGAERIRRAHNVVDRLAADLRAALAAAPATALKAAPVAYVPRIIKTGEYAWEDTEPTQSLPIAPGWEKVALYAAPVSAPPGWTPLALAKRFHEIYERLAPKFGYETRPETREFDLKSANGALMVAVCDELLAKAAPEAREP